MSHRAVVAIADPPDADTVSLYHSQNGADQLRLFPHLDELFRKDPAATIADVNAIPNDIETTVDSLLSDVSSDHVDTEPIAPEPIQDQLQTSSFAETLDFVQYEAAYCVNLPPAADSSGDAPVEMYLPIFLDVGILLLFSRFIDFEAYPRAELPDDFDEVTDRIMEQSPTPEFTLHREEYLEITEQPAAHELFIDSHMGLLQTLYSVSEQPEHDELITMVVSGDYYVVGRVDTSADVPLPKSHGSGLLVRLPVADLDFPQLVSLYQDWRYLADRLRVTHALDALEGFATTIVEGDPSTFSVDEYETALLEELGEEFDSSISARSPAALYDRV